MTGFIRKLLFVPVKKGISALYPVVLGRHPRNTICSFNYHNVSHINRFIASVEPSLNSSICLIDIGAGKSPYYSFFSKKVSYYIAVDCTESLPVLEMRSICQVEGVAECVPLMNSIADVVLSNQVLEHVNDPEQAVREAYRLLRPGGRFIGSVPHISPVHLEPYDFRRYTDYGINKMLSNAGFIDIRIDLSGGVYSAAALMIAMDWVLSPRHENKPQGFSMNRAIALAPVIGFMNALAFMLDKLSGVRASRSFANLCWSAEKPMGH
ncbi:MAG: class I SAM-dependent methyltransferase [Balneolales bacterium]